MQPARCSPFSADRCLPKWPASCCPLDSLCLLHRQPLHCPLQAATRLPLVSFTVEQAWGLDARESLAMLPTTIRVWLA